jgi:hypothetical protein
LAQEQESRNEVVHELRVTAVRLRAKLGEPSDSLARFNQPLEKALSASLEALQAGTQGGKLFLTGDTAGALKLYQRLTEKCRLDAEINYYSYTVGDSEKVYSSALRFLEIFPRDVPAHANFRMALLFLGQPDRAVDEAAEIARLQPGAYRFGSATQSIRFASRFSEAKSWLAKIGPP